MQNQFICILFKLSERLKPRIFCSSYLHRRNVDYVTHYGCMLCIIILMHMYRLQNCYYLDTMTSCYLKEFPNPVRFHFQGVFLSSPSFVQLKLVIGSVAPPIDHLRNHPWTRTVIAPFLFFINHSNNYCSR